jgi:hypothetical protein
MHDNRTRVESSGKVNPLSELAAAPVTLAAPLSIRYGHTGIVGFTGHQIDIKCDGSWSLSKALQSFTGPITKSGKLSEGEIKALIGILTESNSLSTLPDKIGPYGVHCPVATIKLGNVKKTAYIRVNGETPLPTSAEQAFRKIVTDVRGLLGISGASEED